MPETKVKHEFICRDCQPAEPCILYYYVAEGSHYSCPDKCVISGAIKKWRRLNRNTTQRTTEGR